MNEMTGPRAEVAPLGHYPSRYDIVPKCEERIALNRDVLFGDLVPALLSGGFNAPRMMDESSFFITPRNSHEWLDDYSRFNNIAGVRPPDLVSEGNHFVRGLGIAPSVFFEAKDFPQQNIPLS